MANVDELGRPLRWFMTEAAKMFHRLRGRRGHFWERRYRACLVKEDLYVLAALRNLDRNPVRAGLVEDPTTYRWSSCAVYATGGARRLITVYPSYLALSRYPKVRQRHYRRLLEPSPDPRLDVRDSRWRKQCVVGSHEFLKRYFPLRGKRGIISLPPQIR